MLKTKINGYSYNQNSLQIEWGDGHKSTFHYVWLRDNAPDNRHANGQKLIDTLSIPLDITAKSVIFTDTLKIEWANDGAVSQFDLAWLRAHAYEKSEVDGRRQRSPLWMAADLAENLPEFAYPQLIADKTHLRDMLAAVRDHGFAILHEVPTVSETLLKAVDLFGYVRETNYGNYFDVKVTSNPTNLAFTGLTLGGHTDNPYRQPMPTLQLLHCLENRVDGGDSTLVDGFRVAEALRQENPAYFELLATAPITFRFQSDDADLAHETTIIETGPWGDVVAIRFNNRSQQAFYMSPDVMEEFYAAYQRFGQMLEDDRYKLTFKMDSGDLMLFDNQRVLHGRIGYTSSGNRHLQGCYADRDSLLSKLAVLERQ
ncbi:MAG: TauD/TfdA family dioxygenase [Chloroflexota bacterium]